MGGDLNDYPDPTQDYDASSHTANHRHRQWATLAEWMNQQDFQDGVRKATDAKLFTHTHTTATGITFTRIDHILT